MYFYALIPMVGYNFSPTKYFLHKVEKCKNQNIFSLFNTRGRHVVCKDESTAIALLALLQAKTRQQRFVVRLSDLLLAIFCKIIPKMPNMSYICQFLYFFIW